MNPYVVASVSEQHKKAVSQAERDAVAEEFKRRLNTKTEGLSGRVYAALPKDKASLDTWLSYQHPTGLPFLNLARLSARLSPEELPVGATFAPARDDAVDFFHASAPYLTTVKKEEFTPTGRALATHIVKAHELDEVHTPPQRSMRSHGHVSPAVVLNEHNRVVSLPKNQQKVRQMFTDIRTTQPIYSPRRWLYGKREDRLIQKAAPDFVYGQGKAMSRKRIQDVVDTLERRAKRREVLARVGYGAAALGGLGYGAWRLIKRR